jgi:ribosome-binding protein aMBF1 (putative translation factor)
MNRKKEIEMENKHLKSLDRFIDEQYGKRGSVKREKFENDYREFKLGVMIRQARLKKGLTQTQLAERTGTNKSYISKIENNMKEVRLSTLQRIIERGLDGKLELAIRL